MTKQACRRSISVRSRRDRPITALATRVVVARDGAFEVMQGLDGSIGCLLLDGGRGRAGDIEEGTREIETAASLDLKRP
jgi:hypothetical protein